MPADAPGVVVACQKGLRSLAACEQLVKAGYPSVGWLSGGFDAARKPDFDTSTGEDMRYGSVAGLQGVLGWTKVQTDEKKGLGGGIYNVLKARFTPHGDFSCRALVTSHARVRR